MPSRFFKGKLRVGTKIVPKEATDLLLAASLSLPDNVGVVELLQLLEERDLPEDGHGHAVLRQGEAHLLEGHDGVGSAISGAVHRAICSYRYM